MPRGIYPRNDLNKLHKFPMDFDTWLEVEWRTLRKTYIPNWHQWRRSQEHKQRMQRRKYQGANALTHFKKHMRVQEKCCAICGVRFNHTFRATSPNQDHDHSCRQHGKRERCEKCLRGVLCQFCNHGLGFFHDSPYVLQAAIEYLEKWGITREN